MTAVESGPSRHVRGPASLHVATGSFAAGAPREEASGESILERAFKLLRVLGATEQPLSLTSLSARSGLPKTTALRMVRTLVGLGALERQVDGCYTIGLGLLEIAALAPLGHGLRAKAMPFIRDLHVATGRAVVLGVLDGSEAVLVERLCARGSTRTFYRVGGRIPLHATAVGQCLLAYAPVALQNEILSGDLLVEPENQHIKPADLRAQLAATRSGGYAVVSRSLPEAMTTVAGPVFGKGGAVVAALGVVAEPPTEDMAVFRSAVAATCNAMSKVLQSPGH